jgi:hypothetical protein
MAPFTFTCLSFGLWVENGMTSLECCEFCAARDREVLIQPAVDRRISDLVQDVVALIRDVPGAGLSGDDSGLKDAFEEWADQLNNQHSIFFDEYDRLAWSCCEEIAGGLEDLELAVIAAFSHEFADHACISGFIENGSLEQFPPVKQVVVNQLYRGVSEFAVPDL